MVVAAGEAPSRQVARGTSNEGADVEFETLMVSDMIDGRITRTETFAPEQLTAALARFEELEARS